jgi:hypothetical protein
MRKGKARVISLTHLQKQSVGVRGKDWRLPRASHSGEITRTAHSTLAAAPVLLPPGACVYPLAQCSVHALKGLACHARVTPASSPASHSRQCSALTSPSRTSRSNLKQGTRQQHIMLSQQSKLNKITRHSPTVGEAIGPNAQQQPYLQPKERFQLRHHAQQHRRNEIAFT